MTWAENMLNSLTTSNVAGETNKKWKSLADAAQTEFAGKLSQNQFSIAAMSGEIAAQRNIPVNLFQSLIGSESSYNPQAVNYSAGVEYKGLGQLSPDIIAQFGVKDPFDPEQNLKASADYLKYVVSTRGLDPNKESSWLQAAMIYKGARSDEAKQLMTERLISHGWRPGAHDSSVTEGGMINPYGDDPGADTQGGSSVSELWKTISKDFRVVALFAVAVLLVLSSVFRLTR